MTGGVFTARRMPENLLHRWRALPRSFRSHPRLALIADTAESPPSFASPVAPNPTSPGHSEPWRDMGYPIRKGRAETISPCSPLEFLWPFLSVLVRRRLTSIRRRVSRPKISTPLSLPRFSALSPPPAPNSHRRRGPHSSRGSMPAQAGKLLFADRTNAH